MNSQQTYSAPCAAYRTAAPHLLELPPDHRERVEWDAHSVSCRECRTFLVSEMELTSSLQALQSPPPVPVRAVVMDRIRDKRHRKLIGMRDVAWGVSAGMAGLILGLMLVRSDGALDPFAANANAEPTASIAVVDEFDRYVADLAGLTAK